MKVIQLPRQGGKTTLLIRYMVEHPQAVCITHNMASAHDLSLVLARALRSAGETNVDARHLEHYRFYTMDNIRALRSQPGTEVVIDNVDLVLGSLVRQPITLVTLTGGE